jgi:hypothetical protein
MKRLSAFLLFALLATLVVAIPASAVQLQAGWYAQFGYVGLGGDQWDTEPPQLWEEGWTPTSSLGQQGSMLVEEPNPVAPGSRRVTLTQGFAADPGIIFEDAGTYPGAYPYYNWVTVWWQTNYDAKRLQLQLFRHHQGRPDELVWRQTTSDAAIGHGNVWNSYPLQSGEQIVFRLAVIPEPQGLTIVSAGIVLGLALIRRRIRK